MKEKLLLLILLFSSAIISTKSYVINMTGRTILLNFYSGRMTGHMFAGYEILGPWIGGKSPNDVMAGLTTTLLPKAIDMRIMTSSEITVSAFKLGSNKSKDKSIKGTKFPTPSKTEVLARDYMITLKTVTTTDGDKQILVVQRLNTSAGIPMDSKDAIKQWPSEKEITRMGMTLEEKIADLKAENEKLHNDIKNLNKKIKHMQKKGSPIGKINNRKEMRSKKHKKIDSNEKAIKKLEKQIAAQQAAKLSADQQDIAEDSAD